MTTTKNTKTPTISTNPTSTPTTLIRTMRIYEETATMNAESIKPEKTMSVVRDAIEDCLVGMIPPQTRIGISITIMKLDCSEECDLVFHLENCDEE